MTQNTQPHEYQVGQIFEGKYKILRELGRGGFGMVYLGYQESMDRQVALKVLKGGAPGEHSGARERFLREVKIIAKLKHPNTVTIHESGETHDGALYMVLEFVEGEELKQILKRDGAQDPLRVCHTARQIAKSLAEAHRHGVVHRDLKPANVMLTRIEGEEDFVKVLDFGVARLLDPKTADLTSVGLPEGERELIGTPRYMSPEQVRGESLTGASDIYSLGLIMYEMLVGEPAVQGDTTMALITQQISPEPLRLWGIEHQDPLIQDIVRIATSKSLVDRFQTAEQMGDALEQAIFNIRQARNLTGSGTSGDFGNALQTGFNQFQQPGPFDQSGFHRNHSGWQGSQTPSGNFQSQQQFDPRQSNPQFGFDPRSTGHGQHGQSGVQPGFDPRSTGHGPAHGHGPQNQQGHGQGSGQYPRAQSGSGPQLAFDPRASQQNPQAQRSGNQHYDHNNAALSQPSSPVDIDVDINDFQPTVERSALSRDSMPSFSELPPVSDEDPFAPDEPEPQVQRRTQPSPRPTATKPPEDDDLVQFSFDMVKILILTATATLAVYASFILIGAALIEILEDPFLRLIATGVLCGGIPLFTALGENSQKERFRVLERPRDRVIRVLIGTTVFSIAAGFLISVVLASTVVRELRTAPNWFVSQETANQEQGLVALNRKASYQVSDAVEWTASMLGLYHPSKVGPDGVPPGRPPAPTRAQNQPKGQAVPADTTSNNGEALDSVPGDGPADKQPTDPSSTDESSNDGTDSAPSGAASENDSKPEPADQPVEDDDDYVRW